MAVRDSGIRGRIGFFGILSLAHAVALTTGAGFASAAQSDWEAAPPQSVLIGESDPNAAVPYPLEEAGSPSLESAPAGLDYQPGAVFSTDGGSYDAYAGGQPCFTDDCCAAGGCEPVGLIQRLHALHAANGVCSTVKLDSIILWRNAPRYRPIFDSASGPVALNANGLQSDVLVAPRLALIHTDNCGRGLEMAYLYAGNFYSNRFVPPVPEGYVTSPPGIYGNEWGAAGTALNQGSATLVGNLQSVEVNGRKQFLNPGTSFLTGFRWLQWNESLLITDRFNDPTEPTITGVDSYSTACFNNLFGGQIGIDGVLLSTSRNIRFDGLIKAGAYYNAAAQRSTYRYTTTEPFGFATTNRNDSPAACSFVGEVGITAVIPLHRNFDLLCGYFGLWLEGLAQPSNQLSKQTLTQFDPPAGTLDTTGGLVLQGVTLGLEGRW